MGRQTGIKGKTLAKQLILRHWVAKKIHICKEKLVSEVASGLVPALKLRQKMNTDRERRTGEEGEKKTKTNVRLVLSQNLKPTLSSQTTQTGTLQKT